MKGRRKMQKVTRDKEKVKKLTEKRNNINSISNYNCSADDTCRSKYQYRIRR